MNIIIFGEIGAGKDAVAEILKEIFPGKIVKLGRKIRGDVDEIHNILSGDKNKRSLYQEYGQGMREIFGKDIWNLILYDSILSGLKNEKTYIIADARQTNEFNFWTNLGFFPVAVIADKEVREERIKSRDGFDQFSRFSHETEISARKNIAKIKQLEPLGKGITIVNNGTIDELRLQVNEAFKRF